MDRDHVITNGYDYLKSNYQVTQSISRAGKWNHEKANSIFESIRKSNKYKDYNFIVKDYEESEIQYEQLKVNDIFDINSLVDKLISLANISEEINQYNEFLNRQYKIVELEISDIYHYIELAHLDPFRAYKAYKLLKEKLILRRQIKDEQLMIDKLKETRLLKCTEDEINKEYTWLNSRQYKPKVLHKLFE